MTVTLNTSLQNQQVDAWGNDLNSGFIDIYTGSQPSANTSPTGTLLVSCALGADAYAASSGGTALNNNSITGTGVAMGTAGYAQQRNAASTRWQYGSVSLNGGSGDVQLSTLNITVSATITISSSTLTQPAS